MRNFDGDRLVRNEITPDCEWVIAGEGVPTIKIDGTCCLIENGKLYRRYELKNGKKAPIGWRRAQDADPVTGDTPGWMPVQSGSEDQRHREAFDNLRMVSGDAPIPDGTYELIGPKIQGNRYGYAIHALIKHQSAMLLIKDFPRTFDDIRDWLRRGADEGIVWHHPDGRVAKIKRRDFGFDWPIKLDGE
jgi:hypothetical protein